MTNDIVPSELIKSLGGEAIGFMVKAPRANLSSVSWFVIGFSLFWLTFTSVLFLALILPTLRGKTDEAITNPSIVVSILTCIGLAMLAGGIYSLTREGGYFIGTETRLIHFNDGKIRSTEWELFSGDVEVMGTNEKGTLTLGLNSGQYVTRENFRGKRYKEFVENKINICEVTGVFAIEEFCRQHIKDGRKN